MKDAAVATKLAEFYQNTRQALLDLRGPHGHWEGELSSSALSTATAVMALDLFLSSQCRQTRGAGIAHHVPAEAEPHIATLISRGLAWLADTQNRDGGWGDTVLSKSNISTTALVWAAFSGGDEPYAAAIGRCEAWLRDAAGDIEPKILAQAIAARYGRDRTFSVPILTTLALRNRLGPGEIAWKLVPQLPFELAALPQRWYGKLKLPVVSYALPALIAIGQVKHALAPGRNPIARCVRNAVKERTLRVLESIQPASGGFLEATPLTSFVVLSLVGAGEAEHPVVRRGIEFLLRSVRDDGSWPIDTNLATWVTTLAVGALNNHVRLAVARDAEDGLPSPSPRYWTAWEGHPPCPPVAHGELTASCPVDESLPPVDAHRIVDWLLSQQYRTIHPYTNAAPGGWAWTDLSGGVPDADDTPGALLALWSLAGPAAAPSAAAGAAWLLDLQNSDGGIPTFCRGWGLLPFDRSSADLTAHTLRAWSVWYDHLPALQARIDRAARRAWRFLAQAQRPDGAWAPLWFGNQHLATEENLTYGTSRVLLALASVREAFLPVEVATTRILNASRWLLAGQNADGGWGGGDATPSSLEETALAVEALCAVRQCTLDVVKDALTKLPSERGVRVSIDRGLGFLIERTQCGRQFDPAPIGFYFAKLWYYEKLYPIVYSLAAAGRASGFYTSRGHEIQT